MAAFAVRQHQGLVQAETVLEVRNLAREGVFSPVSFQLHKGELLGFAGLVGAKRTDVMRVLFGADKKTSGEIFVKGRKAEIKSPVDALRQGIGLIPENRKTQGMVRMLTMRIMWAWPPLRNFAVWALSITRKSRKIVKPSLSRSI